MNLAASLSEFLTCPAAAFGKPVCRVGLAARIGMELTTGDVLFSLLCYVITYATIFGFGLFFIHRLLRDGPGRDASDRAKMTPARPLAVAMQASTEAPQ